MPNQFQIAFVIGADERHVSYAIKNKFKDIEGINMDIGKEYQEKIIQYSFKSRHFLSHIHCI